MSRVEVILSAAGGELTKHIKNFMFLTEIIKI
jgi:hypothetical protein